MWGYSCSKRSGASAPLATRGRQRLRSEMSHEAEAVPKFNACSANHCHGARERFVVITRFEWRALERARSHSV